LLVTAFLLIWQYAISPQLPQEANRIDHHRGPIIWVAPDVGPVYCRQDLDEASTLMIGDSRVWLGVDPRIVDRKVSGSLAVIWAASARTLDMLQALEHYDTPRVVVALSALGLHPHISAPQTGIFDRPFPDLEAGRSEEQIAAWHDRQVVRLGEMDIEEDQFNKFLRPVENLMRKEFAKTYPTTANFDAYWNNEISNLREEGIRTISTLTWRGSWFINQSPETSNRSYRDVLGGVDESERRKNLDRVMAALIAAREAGREIVCIRVPISPALRTIEDREMPPELFTQACEQASIPFFDLTREDFSTKDGSHLNRPAAHEFSHRLADWLKNDVGW